MTDIDPKFVKMAEKALPCADHTYDSCKGMSIHPCPKLFRPTFAKLLQEAYEMGARDKNDALLAKLGELKEKL